MKIRVVLVKLHKEVFLTCDIFFVNKIPFFLTLSQKIYFTTGNHLENITVPEKLERPSRRYTRITYIVDSASPQCMQTASLGL